MTLCDTSPLIALINQKDPQHGRCVAVLPRLKGPFLTTWPCFTEAMYLARRYGGRMAEQALWGFVTDQLLVIRSQTEAELLRMRELMDQYHDRPMDLADASLVAAAEALRQRLIFTLDSDFRFYRYQGNQSFEVVPD